jgi:hypothetical protein
MVVKMYRSPKALDDSICPTRTFDVQKNRLHVSRCDPETQKLSVLRCHHWQRMCSRNPNQTRPVHRGRKQCMVKCMLPIFDLKARRSTELSRMKVSIRISLNSCDEHLRPN